MMVKSGVPLHPILCRGRDFPSPFNIALDDQAHRSLYRLPGCDRLAKNRDYRAKWILCRPRLATRGEAYESSLAA